MTCEKQYEKKNVIYGWEIRGAHGFYMGWLHMRTHGVNQALRFVEGILVSSKESSNPLFFGKDLFYIIRAQHVLSYHLL